MRFITEFKELKQEKGEFVEMYKSDAAARLGDIIEESFGWVNPVNGNALHHRLEIEAFPMEKWIEFKNKLWGECTMPCPNGTDILEMLKELESFGKPAGDTITNKKLTNGTE